MSLFRLFSTALAVAVSVPVTTLASNINGEATYVSFQIPGAQGTYPTAINSSMTVTGFYQVSNTVAEGFIRTADGTIEIFSGPGALSTLPKGINAAGDVAGDYQAYPSTNENHNHGFLRYANGRMINVDPPGLSAGQEVLVGGINDYDEITATVVDGHGNGYAFTRTREGVFTSITQFGNLSLGLAINDSGTVAGYYIPTDQSAGDSEIGFVSHPDGYAFSFSVRTALSGCSASATQTLAMNAGGSVIGLYSAFCPSYQAGSFVMTPEGKVSVFDPPGKMALANMAINADGDITGGVIDSTGLHGFVRNPYETFTVFDPPESDARHSTSPSGINEAGVITGYYARHGIVGFLRIPYSQP